MRWRKSTGSSKAARISSRTKAVAALSEGPHDTLESRKHTQGSDDRKTALSIRDDFSKTFTNPPLPHRADDKTAEEYALEGGATLHLVLALRGGSS
jgi:hypothetical protein